MFRLLKAKFRSFREFLWSDLGRVVLVFTALAGTFLVALHFGPAKNGLTGLHLWADYYSDIERLPSTLKIELTNGWTNKKVPITPGTPSPGGIYSSATSPLCEAMLWLRGKAKSGSHFQLWDGLQELQEGEVSDTGTFTLFAPAVSSYSLQLVVWKSFGWTVRGAVVELRTPNDLDAAGHFPDNSGLQFSMDGLVLRTENEDCLLGAVGPPGRKVRLVSESKVVFGLATASSCGYLLFNLSPNAIGSTAHAEAELGHKGVWTRIGNDCVIADGAKTGQDSKYLVRTKYRVRLTSRDVQVDISIKIPWVVLSNLNYMGSDWGATPTLANYQEYLQGSQDKSPDTLPVCSFDPDARLLASLQLSALSVNYTPLLTRLHRAPGPISVSDGIATVNMSAAIDRSQVITINDQTAGLAIGGLKGAEEVALELPAGSDVEFGTPPPGATTLRLPAQKSRYDEYVWKFVEGSVSIAYLVADDMQSSSWNSSYSDAIPSKTIHRADVSQEIDPADPANQASILNRPAPRSFLLRLLDYANLKPQDCTTSGQAAALAVILGILAASGCLVLAPLLYSAQHDQASVGRKWESCIAALVGLSVSFPLWKMAADDFITPRIEDRWHTLYLPSEGLSYLIGSLSVFSACTLLWLLSRGLRYRGLRADAKLWGLRIGWVGSTKIGRWWLLSDQQVAPDARWLWMPIGLIGDVRLARWLLYLAATTLTIDLYKPAWGMSSTVWIVVLCSFVLGPALCLTFDVHDCLEGLPILGRVARNGFRTFLARLGCVLLALLISCLLILPLRQPHSFGLEVVSVGAIVHLTALWALPALSTFAPVLAVCYLARQLPRLDANGSSSRIRSIGTAVFIFSCVGANGQGPAGLVGLFLAYLVSKRLLFYSEEARKLEEIPAENDAAYDKWRDKFRLLKQSRDWIAGWERKVASGDMKLAEYLQQRDEFAAWKQETTDAVREDAVRPLASPLSYSKIDASDRVSRVWTRAVVLTGLLGSLYVAALLKVGIVFDSPVPILTSVGYALPLIGRLLAMIFVLTLCFNDLKGESGSAKAVRLGGLAILCSLPPNLLLAVANHGYWSLLVAAGAMLVLLALAGLFFFDIPRLKEIDGMLFGWRSFLGDHRAVGLAAAGSILASSFGLVATKVVPGLLVDAVRNGGYLTSPARSQNVTP